MQQMVYPVRLDLSFGGLESVASHAHTFLVSCGSDEEEAQEFAAIAAAVFDYILWHVYKLFVNQRSAYDLVLKDMLASVLGEDPDFYAENFDYHLEGFADALGDMLLKHPPKLTNMTNIKVHITRGVSVRVPYGVGVVSLEVDPV